MEPSRDHELNRVLFDTEVAIFGIVDIGRGVKVAAKTAERHLAEGADFVDLHLGSGWFDGAVDQLALRDVITAVSQVTSGRVAMLNDDASTLPEATWRLLAFVRKAADLGGDHDMVVDVATNHVVAKCCSTAGSTFSDSLACLRQHRGQLGEFALHLCLPEAKASMGKGEPSTKGVIAAEVALAVIEGAQLLSVHEVHSAVKARDEIVKIRHAD